MGNNQEKKFRFIGRSSSTMLLMLLLASALPLQEGRSGQKTQRVPHHDAAAVIKLVTVRVLDQEGKPVTGLTKEDFILYDNKEIKSITEFEVHSIGRIGNEPERKEPPTLGATARETNRKFFILLDVQGSDETGNANSKKAALHFVETKLNPGDEAAVLYFGQMTGLNLVQYLTADKDKVKKAIEKAKEHPPSPGFVSGGADDSVHERMPEQGEIVPQRARRMGGGGSGSENPVEERASVPVAGLGTLGGSGSDFQMSMSELAKALQYIPGSKNLFFFSGRGVSPVIGREFAAANIPVFTVNTKNWIQKGVYRVSIKEKYIWEEHPLKEFSLASGGQYYADIEKVQAIADSIQVLTGHYYVLGYYIDEKWDGKFHQIKVEVRKPDCRVLAQDGYYNPKPFAQLSEIEKKLHLYDLAYTDRPTMQDPLELLVESFTRAGTAAPNTLFLSKIAVDEKIGIPPGRIELLLLVFDKDRQTRFSRRWETDLKPYARQTLCPYCACYLEPGEYECRLVARDLETGQSARGSMIFEVPTRELLALELLPPLLLIPGEPVKFSRLAEAGKGGKPAVSILDFFPALPEGCAPILGILEKTPAQLWAVVPARFEDGRASEVELTTTLTVLETGEKIPLDSEILDVKATEEKIHFVVMEINLPDLGSGEYELEIAALDSATQTAAAVKSRLVKR
jgi:VWFA-related protein